MTQHIRSFFEIHRPRFFRDIIGNAGPKRLLEGMFRSEQIHNGFSLHGDNGVGKTTMARCLARSLTCNDREAGSLDACGICSNCISVDGIVWGSGIRVRNCSELTFEDVREDFNELLYANGAMVFYYDEFQRCKHRIQDLLVTKLETDRSFMIMISTPYPSEIKEKALRQRLIPLCLSAPTNEEMTRFIAEVGRKEGVKQIEEAFISQLCREHGNNPRECLNDLQQLLYQTDALTFDACEKLGRRKNIQSIIVKTHT